MIIGIKKGRVDSKSIPKHKRKELKKPFFFLSPGIHFRYCVWISLQHLKRRLNRDLRPALLLFLRQVLGLFCIFRLLLLIRHTRKIEEVFGASISPYRRNLLPITIKPFRRSRRLFFFFFALPYLPPLFSWIYTNSPFYFGPFFLQYATEWRGSALMCRERLARQTDSGDGETCKLRWPFYFALPPVQKKAPSTHRLFVFWGDFITVCA